MREVCADETPEKLAVMVGLWKSMRAHFQEEKNNRKNYPPQWVFGGVCRETEEVFLVTVPDRTAETVMSCIEKYVEKSLIMADCWSS